MGRYDFLGNMEVILSNIWIDFNLTQFHFWSTFSLAQIMTTYDFLSAKQVILSNVRTDFNLTQFLFWSTFARIFTYNDHIWLPIG